MSMNLCIYVIYNIKGYKFNLQQFFVCNRINDCGSETGYKILMTKPKQGLFSSNISNEQ